jgi:uncharacterized protein (TIGR03083 family)
MTTAATRQAIEAAGIPPLTRAQTEKVAHRELETFVALLERLAGSEWEQPTACDLWSVRDVVAHQGGHVQAGRGMLGMFAQLNPMLARPYRKRRMNALDAMNQAQVDMRREWPVERLIAEVREGTTEAIEARRRLSPAAKIVRVPAPDYGLIRIDYLLHVVFPRDMWIHRLDVADATGRPFELDEEHDGTLLSHVVRDMERNVRKRLPGRSVRLTVEGPGGGTWRLGQGDEVPVEIGVLDFMRLSSGRLKAERRGEVAEVGVSDQSERERVLGALAAVY